MRLTAVALRELLGCVRRRNEKHEYQGIGKVNRDRNDNE